MNINYQRIERYICLLMLLLCFCLSAKAQSTQKQIDSMVEVLNRTTIDSMKIRALHRIGLYQNMGGMSEEAIKTHYKGIAATSKDNVYWLGVGHYYIGSIFARKSQIDSALYHSHLGMKYILASGRKNYFLPLVISDIGASYMTIGKYQEAIKWAFEELRASEEIKDNSSIANSYNLIAAIYEAMGERGRAMEYVEKAVQLKRSTGSYFNLSNLLGNLAAFYIEKEETLPKAYTILHEALYLCNSQYPSKYDEGSILKLLGVYHTRIHNYDSAAYYLDKAEVLHKDLNAVDLVEVYYHQLHLYRDAGQYEKASEYADKAKELVYSQGLANAYISVLNERHQFFAAAGYYNKAYEELKLLGKLRDSIGGEESKKIIADLEKKYEVEKKNKEILLLESANKLNALRINQQLQLNTLLQNENLLKAQKIITDSALNTSLTNENVLKQQQLIQAEQLNKALEIENQLKQKNIIAQRNTLYLLAAGFLFILISASVFYYQYNKQKQANLIIAQQSDKLSLLMKELHHRVKNNLQIVSSLLSLQSFRMKDDAAIAAVKEGQHRIEAMSLIHQKLYTKDDVTSVNIKEFIADIAESLAGAYGFSSDRFKLLLDVENEIMNVDTAIPLSLIINELITNSLKHAFAVTDMAYLTVKLQREGGDILLTIADNGKGINMDNWNNNNGSFGKELINTFTNQLKGKISIKVDSGTKVVLIFPYQA